MSLRLLVVLVVLLSGCMCNPANLKSTPAELCPENYIQVGKECCLDRNTNSICDQDETTQTTYAQTTYASETIPPSTSPVTTAAPSTAVPSTAAPTTAPPSTTLEIIACTVNSDCGERLEERICYNGDVFVQRSSPMCRKGGTPESNCISKIVRDNNAVEQCSGSDSYCKDGECVHV